MMRTYAMDTIDLPDYTMPERAINLAGQIVIGGDKADIWAMAAYPHNGGVRLDGVRLRSSITDLTSAEQEYILMEILADSWSSIGPDMFYPSHEE